MAPYIQINILKHCIFVTIIIIFWETQCLRTHNIRLPQPVNSCGVVVPHDLKSPGEVFLNLLSDYIRKSSKEPAMCKLFTVLFSNLYGSIVWFW